MATNPTKEDLMAYLYDELSDEKRKKLEIWLKENPETMKEVEELGMVRKTLGAVEDKEVVDPYFYGGTSSLSPWQVTRIISNTIIKPVIGLAAAITLMFLVGFLTDFNMNTSNGYLSVSFGPDQETPSVAQMDEQQVQLIVNRMLQEENTQLDSEIADLEEGLKSQLASYYEEQKNQFNSNLNTNTQNSNQAIADVVRQLQRDNLDYMERYLELASRNQEQNMKIALTEFSDFLASQREEDLNRIQYNLTTLQESQDIQRIETDQILATILNTVNKERNN